MYVAEYGLVPFVCNPGMQMENCRDRAVEIVLLLPTLHALLIFNLLCYLLEMH